MFERGVFSLLDQGPYENAAWPDILAWSFLISPKVVQDVTYLVDIFPIP
jgi:hypothetical protein